MENSYNVDTHKIPALQCYMLFGQKQLFEKVESNINDIETAHDSKELSPVKTRNQKEIGHLDFVLPTKKSIREMVAEFSLSCYKNMA